MKRALLWVAFLCAAVWLLTSCGNTSVPEELTAATTTTTPMAMTTPTTTISSATATATTANTTTTTTSATTTTQNATVSATMTTTAIVSCVTATTTTANTTATTTTTNTTVAATTTAATVSCTTISKVNALALADLDWDSVDALYVCHTESPPFRAVTLRTGTPEFDTLRALLRKVEGAYVRSSKGYYGGMTPIFLLSGGKTLDRVQISVDVAADSWFTSNTRREGGYPFFYTLSPALRTELNAFLETLTYTEDIVPPQ